MNMSWSLWMTYVGCLLFALVGLLVAQNGNGQTGDCPPLTSNQLIDYLSTERFSGEGQEDQKVTLQLNNTNCETVGTSKGTYRSLSLSVRYENPLMSTTEYARASFACITNNDVSDWNGQYFNRITDTNAAQDLLMADTLRNCSSCTGNTAGLEGKYECEACSSNCNTGLGYCIGPDSDECCSYYDDNVCVADCTGNQHSDSMFDCVCDEFYQETQCTTCILDQSDCLHGTPDTSTCDCDCTDTGYTGKLCTDDIDECQGDSPCVTDHTQSCINKNGTYQCVCLTGYDGMDCDNNIDDCANNPCQFGGTCHDGVASFTCTCVPGYTGDTCGTDINECEGNPCRNGGTCTDRVNDYSCECVDQYQGKSCEEDVDECVTLSPCQNEGRCINTDGGYRCECVGKWINAHCDTCYIDQYCLRLNCSGPRYECLACVESYTPVHPDKGGCVLCLVDNCTSCDREGFCQECAFDLVSNGTVCKPREEDKRVGALEIGAIFGIIIGLGVLIAIVVVTIVVVFVASLRIRAAKPIQMVVKNPIENKDPIVLQKHTAL